MAIEPVRSCGYRKVGGLYLCGGGALMQCDRIPFEIISCPVCNSGVKFSRGFTWLDWDKYAGIHEGCKCPNPLLCPVCVPSGHPQPYGLMWVGSDYTPESFTQEALVMGVSKRIAAPIRNLKLGETWVLLANTKACGERPEEQEDGTTKTVGIPGIFYVFRPQRVEQLIWESDFNQEKVKELTKRGITPIVIPNGDVDHDPRTSLKPKDEEKTEVLFSNLRDKLRG